MDIFRKLVIFMYVIALIMALLFLSDRNFRALQYGDPEVVLPWVFMVLSSIISIYFIGYRCDLKSKNENVLSLWLKRKKLEEKKRIKDLEK